MVKYRVRRKYKYTTYSDLSYDTGIKLDNDHKSEFIDLDRSGKLLIKTGYSWDGATWFPDTKQIMLASLVHDALYQLMREGVLKSINRDAADIILRDICRDSGMSRWLSNRVYGAVKMFAKYAASGEPLIAK